MTPEERHELIEAYLDGRMPPGERLRFEEALARDATLAKELALHRELGDTFGDPDWLARRRQLAALSDEFRDQPAGPRPRRLWWILAVVGFGILLLWWLRRETSEQKDDPTVSEAPISREEPGEAPGAVSPPPPTEVPAEEPSAASGLPRHDPFKALPELEEALNRPPDSELEVTQGTLETERRDGGRRRLIFRGLLRSAQEPPALELHLRDNRPAIRQPLQRLPVQVSPLADPPVRAFAAKKEWQLQSEARVTLAPGRYYGSLVRIEDGRIIWTGALEVRE